MYQQFYANSDLLIWPLVGLGIFFLSFLAVLYYVLVLLRRNPAVDRMALLPLEGDPPAEEPKEGSAHE